MINLTLALLLVQSPPESFKPAEDKSLTSEEYIKKGVPAFDREWTSADYQAAVKALKEIRAKDPLTLPRFGSKSSGPLFERMCSEDNLASLKNKEVSAATRLKTGGRLLVAVGEVLALYKPVDPGTGFGLESIELTGLMLKSTGPLFILWDESIAALPKDDPEREKRNKSMEPIQTGMTQMFIGAMTVLGNARSPAEDRIRLASLLETTLPSVVHRLPKNTRAEFSVKLQGLFDAEKVEELKKPLGDLQKKVEDAIKACQ